MLMREAVRESWPVTKRRVQSFRKRFGATDRGISTALNYVLVLGMVTILVTTLLGGFGGLVANQQESATRAQLEVIGNRVAADLGQVDTLANHAADNNTVSVRTDLPTRVVGSPYTITVDKVGTDSYELTLTTGDRETMVTVPFRSTTPVVEKTIYGGPFVFEVDSTGDSAEVVIRHA